MKNLNWKINALVLISLLMSATSAVSEASERGLFPDQTDVGSVRKPGSVEYDSALGSYMISGGGENMWFTNDAFHYVWKRMAGDLTLAANIRWIGTNGNAHRKAGLIIRQSLDGDSPYADVAVHGDGLTSLQYRETKGGPTREIQANTSAPDRARLEKRGNYVSMSLATAGEALWPAGGSFRIQFSEPFYVGLGVCAHDNNAIARAEFSRVEITTLPPSVGPPTNVQSTLEFISIASKDRRVVYHTSDHIEAPNWSRDGQSLLFNSKGRIWRMPVTGGVPQAIDTGFAMRCNNDHGISPDGTQLVISDQSQSDRRSRIYILPAGGGTPRRITETGPSYWHGWSPDGQTLAYCGERNGEFDIYTILVAGGAETRLTKAQGLDDGPDYSPDGRFIYFNSDRTGRMQIWRMKPDGSQQEQVTTDEWNNWFPHPSPDGKWLVFLSYAKEIQGHPENKDVILRLMPVMGGEIQVLAKLFGGQGTINVPSWSPDSRRVAFVSYQAGFANDRP